MSFLEKLSSQFTMPPTNQDNNDSTIKITFVGLESHFNKIDGASQDQLTSASKATGKKNLNKIKNRIKYIMAKGISISDLFSYRSWYFCTWLYDKGWPSVAIKSTLKPYTPKNTGA